MNQRKDDYRCGLAVRRFEAGGIDVAACGARRSSKPARIEYKILPNEIADIQIMSEDVRFPQVNRLRLCCVPSGRHLAP